MFEQLMRRSNWVLMYKMDCFAEERRAFLCDLNERGHSLRTLRNVNELLLAIAERVNVRQAREITETRRSSERLGTGSRSPARRSEGKPIFQTRPRTDPPNFTWWHT